MSQTDNRKTPTTYATFNDWRTEARRRFKSQADVRFICPCCGHKATVAEYRAAGATDGEIGFSCIGRRMPEPRDALGDGPGPCNYAGGGLFRLGPTTIQEDPEHRYFNFAEPG